MGDRVHVPLGYDFHITRAEHWIDSAANSIPDPTWLAVVRSDQSLRIDRSNELQLRDPETGAERSLHPVVWAGPGGEVPFWYDRGEITVKNPSEATVVKMKSLATQLGARVLGDDGEVY